MRCFFKTPYSTIFSPISYFNFLPQEQAVSLFFPYIHPVGWGCRICRLHLCRGLTPPTRLSVGRRWQPVMLEDGILVAEQSMTWQLKRSCDPQHSTLALIGLDRLSERPTLISRLVMSAHFWVCVKIPMRTMAVGFSHDVERLIALSVPGQVVILGTKTQGQNKII